ncbi:MBL fold metallo-hydrolase [Bowmanella denitrificans]|uniref:MBL fold metallo-hydrolase n=1 Tax=Bowmanella denitrificans TaxID=366582 RepID=UPI000C9BA742|nr:MBL fold metallo-hydrolase [Bowmanella denitrificans]
MAFTRIKTISSQTLSAALLTASLCAPAETNADSVDIQWLGGPTMLIEFGPIRLLTDPMLGEGHQAYKMGDPNEMFDLSIGPNIKDHARLVALPEWDAEDLDLVLISHSHEDHFDQTARATLSRQLKMLAPAVDTPLLNELGFTQHVQMPWNKTWRYNEGDYAVSITAMPTAHSTDADIQALLGHGNGYWITFSHQSWSKNLYWAGDTFITAPLVEQLKRQGDMDIFIPHLGGVGTTGPLGKISMDASDSIAAIQQLVPEHTLPIHHTTYGLYLEPISKLLAEAEKHHIQVDLPATGSWLSYR